MDEYIKEIINRNHSNDYIRKKLYMIIPKIVEYYGEKNLNTIIEAIKSVEFCLCPFEKEMARFIDDRLYLKIDNYHNNYLNRDLINSSGALSYSIAANVAYDVDNEEFVNKGIDRKIIFIKEGFQNEEYILKTIIHEFIIQIKGILKNNIIRNGKRISRNGVLQTYYLIKKDDDLITLDFVSESGRGFNKAMCEYDTLMIFASIFGYGSPLCAYPLEVEILKRIIKNDTLLEDIHTHEIDGDIPKLRNIFDSTFKDGSFDKTIAFFDKVLHSSYRSNKEIYDKLRDEALDFIASLNIQDKPIMKVI